MSFDKWLQEDCIHREQLRVESELKEIENLRKKGIAPATGNGAVGVLRPQMEHIALEIRKWRPRSYGPRKPMQGEIAGWPYRGKAKEAKD